MISSISVGDIVCYAGDPRNGIGIVVEKDQHSNYFMVLWDSGNIECQPFEELKLL